MKNFIHPGRVLPVPAPADVKSGDLVFVGDLFGVAEEDALSGAEVEIVTEGVWDLPKVSAQAWTVGAKLYWDASAKKATTASSGNKPIGCATAVAANPSDTGHVRLRQSW